MRWIADIMQTKQNKEARERTERANRELMAQLSAASDKYAALRPFNSAARQAAMQNIVGLYEPANQMLGEMSGGRYQMNLAPLTQRWPDMFNMQLAAQQAAAPPQQMARPQEPMPAPGWSSVGRQVSPVQLAGERATSAAQAQASPQLAALRRGIR